MVDNTEKKQELIDMINKASKTEKLSETINVVFFEMMRLNFTTEDISDVLENTNVTSEE